MKKVLIAVITVMSLGVVNAQNEGEDSNYGFSDGNFMIEGSLVYNNTNDKTVPNVEKSISNLAFKPKVGYFITDEFAVGVELNTGTDKYEITNFTTATTTTDVKSTLKGGVFARYYLLELGKRFKFYSEAGLGLGTNKGKVTNTNGIISNSTEKKSRDVYFGVDLGMNYFVSKRVAISFVLSDVLSVNSNKVNGASGSTTNTNINLNVFNNFFSAAQFGLLFKI